METESQFGVRVGHVKSRVRKSTGVHWHSVERWNGLISPIIILVK